MVKYLSNHHKPQALQADTRSIATRVLGRWMGYVAMVGEGVCVATETEVEFQPRVVLQPNKGCVAIDCNGVATE